MLHLVGSEDRNTPPALIQSAVANPHVGGTLQIIDGYTHNCCWIQVWPDVLARAGTTAQTPGAIAR